ncbi:MAG TPA: holliday junction resolvasome, helicase subunit [Pseudomonas sp.]|nr:holliday junction resolvasome, helicase subunit [Pseudomonas sp.]
MNKYLLSVAAAACLVAGTASAGSITGTIDAIGASLVNTVEGTSDITSNLGDDKLVLDARDDAARFVASNGEARGAQLEAALKHIRTQAPGLQASDLQLAGAILAL